MGKLKVLYPQAYYCEACGDEYADDYEYPQCPDCKRCYFCCDSEDACQLHLDGED